MGDADQSRERFEITGRKLLELISLLAECCFQHISTPLPF